MESITMLNEVISKKPIQQQHPRVKAVFFTDAQISLAIRAHFTYLGKMVCEGRGHEIQATVSTIMQLRAMFGEGVPKMSAVEILNQGVFMFTGERK